MVGRFGLPSCILLVPSKSTKMLTFVIILLCFIPQTCASKGEDVYMFDPNLFAERLVEDFGTEGYISVKQLETLMTKVQKNQASDQSSLHSDHDPGDTQTNGKDHGTDSVTTCQLDDEPNKCIIQKCLSASNIFSYHSLSENSSVNLSQFTSMTPTVLYQLQNSACAVTRHSAKHAKPSATQVWGYGFLCVTLINLCAITGMVFLPLMKKSFYTRLLMFMVALAVGTLAGSSLLFLIPECFGMTHDDSPLLDEYIWKSTAIIGGVYLFFLTERLLKMTMSFRRKRKHEKKPANILSSIHDTRHQQESMNMSFEPPSKLVETGNLLCSNNEDDDKNSLKVGTSSLMSNQPALLLPVLRTSVVANGNAHGHSHGQGPVVIKSVAWMIIFGDGLHNFIDGLSIGAAFAGNIMTGFSVSVAVICEELPHELGDFAILLNSGMSMWQALGYNFLSACMCYLGLVIGVLVGEMTSGAEWIFAVAGGMFLYISLVDMLPEVNHAAESEDEENNQLTVFFIQNSGLLFGYGIMLFLACFSGEIDFTT